MKGNDIKILRESAGLSQQEMAAALDCRVEFLAGEEEKNEVLEQFEFRVWKWYMARFSPEWWGPFNLEFPAWLENYASVTTQIARTPLQGLNETAPSIPPAGDAAQVLGGVEEFLYEKGEVERVIVNYLNLVFSRFHLLKLEGIVFYEGKGEIPISAARITATVK